MQKSPEVFWKPLGRFLLVSDWFDFFSTIKDYSSRYVLIRAHSRTPFYLFQKPASMCVWDRHLVSHQLLWPKASSQINILVLILRSKPETTRNRKVKLNVRVCSDARLDHNGLRLLGFPGEFQTKRVLISGSLPTAERKQSDSSGKAPHPSACGGDIKVLPVSPTTCMKLLLKWSSSSDRLLHTGCIKERFPGPSSIVFYFISCM